MKSMKSKKVVVIGGSSGIGLATAKGAVALGAEVIIAARTPEKLERARQEIGHSVETATLDMSQEEQVRSFFEQVGAFDHLTTPGGYTSGGGILSLETSVAQQSFANKFWGQYFAAKYGAPQIRPGGSIVLISGQLSQRPSAGAVMIASVNSAVEGLGRALAVELAPIRVNSPVAGVPELRPGTLSAELGSKDGAFTPPSGGGAPAPLPPRDRPRPKERGFSLA